MGDPDLAATAGQRLVDVLDPAPVGDQHEQRAAILAAEHAREAEAIEVDSLEHLTAFAHTGAALRDHRRPHGTLGIQADAVAALPEICPYAAVREAPVGCDVERGQPAGT